MNAPTHRHTQSICAVEALVGIGQVKMTNQKLWFLEIMLLEKVFFLTHMERKI